jgi:hypothetical protein
MYVYPCQAQIGNRDKNPKCRNKTNKAGSQNVTVSRKTFDLSEGELMQRVVNAATLHIKTKETIETCLINSNVQALCFWSYNHSGPGSCFWIDKGSSRQHFGHQTAVHSIAPCTVSIAIASLSV